MDAVLVPVTGEIVGMHERLALVDRGLDPYLGTATYLEAHRQTRDPLALKSFFYPRASRLPQFVHRSLTAPPVPPPS